MAAPVRRPDNGGVARLQAERRAQGLGSGAGRSGPEGGGRRHHHHTTYRNFELALEWKISSGGNSGILYRVTEESEGDLRDRPRDAGAGRCRACRRCQPADLGRRLLRALSRPGRMVHPAGEWNTVRIVVQGNHVEHWLNGVKVVEYELRSPDWEAKVAASKFSQWPGYGRARRAHRPAGSRGRSGVSEHQDQGASVDRHPSSPP